MSTDLDKAKDLCKSLRKLLKDIGNDNDDLSDEIAQRLAAAVRTKRALAAQARQTTQEATRRAALADRVAAAATDLGVTTATLAALDVSALDNYDFLKTKAATTADIKLALNI